MSMKLINHQAGLILIFVMVFVFVTSLLTLSFLEQGLLEIKMANRFKERLFKDY